MNRPGLVGLVLIGTALIGCGPGAAAGPAPMRLVEVAPGLYLRSGAQADASPANRGHIANLGLVVGRTSAAVIDTGGSLAEGRALRVAVRQITALPISHVILTHMHPDHVLGAAAFEADGPEFVGHHALADALLRRASHYLARAGEVLGELSDGTRVVLPQRSVRDRLEIDLGGRVLELRAWPTAHTNNDLSIYDRNSSTLWLSDLLFVERIPVIDGSLTGWLQVMAALRELPAQRVVPGHGPMRKDWPDALDDQQRYLETVAAGLRRVIRARGRIQDALGRVAMEERPNWLLFDAYHGRNLTAGFVELEWE